jgi:hypothetical protein
MLNKRGQILSILFGAPILIAIILIIIVISVFGIGLFIHMNLLQLLGGSIIILTIIFGLGPAIAKPNQIVLTLILTFVFIGGLLIATPYVADSLNFSVADISHSWENTSIKCSDVQDCVNGLKKLEFSSENIEANLENIKCEEVCYLRE